MASVIEPTGPSELPRARGAIDAVSDGPDGHTVVSGWLIHPREPLDAVSVVAGGEIVGTDRIRMRRDIADLFPSIRHAGGSGFAVACRSFADAGTLVIVGSYQNQPRTVLLGRPTGPTRDAHPDAHLMARVGGSEDAVAYAQIGREASIDIHDAVLAAGGRLDGRILDWGCGPGRVAAPLLELCPQAELDGCDIDAEAIAWCQSNLPRGRYRTCGFGPPLPYDDSSFDVVMACSVMTHLARAAQLDWLTDVRRVLRPGGLFVASVHGSFAADFFPAVAAVLPRVGIVDGLADPTLDGIAPSGYYRSTFQTQAWTQQQWSTVLKPVSYEVAGLAGFQDLVVFMR